MKWLLVVSFWLVAAGCATEIQPGNAGNMGEILSDTVQVEMRNYKVEREVHDYSVGFKISATVVVKGDDAENRNGIFFFRIKGLSSDLSKIREREMIVIERGIGEITAFDYSIDRATKRLPDYQFQPLGYIELKPFIIVEDSLQ